MAGSDQQILAGILGTGLVSCLGSGEPAHAGALAEPPPPPAWMAAGELEPGKSLPYRPVRGNRALLEMAVAAVEQAVQAAGLEPAALAQAGLFLGSSSLDIGLSEERYARSRREDHDAQPMAEKRSGYGMLAEMLAARLGLGGPRLTFNTACSSSANAALYAARMIARGEIDRALVLGTESWNRLSLLGFASLMLVSEAGARPFDAHRDGLVLGEGVGALLLGSARPGQAAQLCGGANLCDTSSATNSQPEQIARVMTTALADARVAAEDLAAIKAHGTSTPSNDQAEGAGMRLAFGERPPPFTSLKGHLGHTLGACGALETAALLATLQAGFLPATAGFTTIDPELGVGPLAANHPAGAGYYLLNYFGFGGNNTSLVMSYAP